jgi:hypothetical protein
MFYTISKTYFTYRNEKFKYHNNYGDSVFDVVLQ